MPPSLDVDAIQVEHMAEDALLLRFGDSIDIRINDTVHAAARCIRDRFPAIECVPAYASLLLRFDPSQWLGDDGRTPHQRISDALLAALTDLSIDTNRLRLHEIPVHYGEADGPDLAEVASMTRLSMEDVIKRHCQVEYRVAMLGFAPGFPYLLGLDAVLSVPRRTDPRQRVPAGSIAIGGSQTGIYPDELPGGWQLIGRTPLRLFEIDANPSSPLAPGDRVRFVPIDATTFRRLDEEKWP
jgi:KipI family sensor histidine kinase inhibitor